MTRQTLSPPRSAPGMPTEVEAAYGGVRTRVLELEGGGPPILLLHGFSDSADTWRPLMAELADSGRRVVAVDLPHFGRAERPRIARPLLDVFGDFVATVVEELDRGDGVVVAGNSLGGLVALRAAENASLPIAAVAAIGPAGFGLQPWVGAVRRVAFAVSALSRSPLPRAVTARLFGQAFARLSVRRALSPEVIERYSSHFGPGDLRRILALANLMLAEISEPGVADLSRIEVPVTLIWGRHDALCPPAGAEAAIAALARAELVMFEEAGHCTHLDEPAAIAELLAELG